VDKVHLKNAYFKMLILDKSASKIKNYNAIFIANLNSKIFVKKNYFIRLIFSKKYKKKTIKTC
jgi:pectate lyase